MGGVFAAVGRGLGMFVGGEEGWRRFCEEEGWWLGSALLEGGCWERIWKYEGTNCQH